MAREVSIFSLHTSLVINTEFSRTPCMPWASERSLSRPLILTPGCETTVYQCLPAYIAYVIKHKTPLTTILTLGLVERRCHRMGSDRPCGSLVSLGPLSLLLCYICTCISTFDVKLRRFQQIFMRLNSPPSLRRAGTYAHAEPFLA